MEVVGTLVRLIWELGVYLVTVLPDLLPIILALATPLALGALCGVLNERSGVGSRTDMSFGEIAKGAFETW